jgi:hypothetical protein
MRWVPIVLAACATPKQPSAPPPEQPLVAMPTPPRHGTLPGAEPATRLIDGAKCVIRSANVGQQIVLRVHGRPFADVRIANLVDLRAAAVGATALVQTPDTTLVGDVDLRQMTVRPRERLYAGWLAIRDAQPGTVNAESMVLDFKLPMHVVPTNAPFVRMPCNTLTLGDAPERPDDGKPVTLKQATKIELRAAPNGPIIATIETPRVGGAKETDPKRELDLAVLAARELARDGTRVKIRTGFRNYVEGWVDAAMLAPGEPTGDFAASATASHRSYALRMKCPHEVPIYVRVPELLRIGTYRANATIYYREGGKDQVPVDLGLPPKLPVEPVGSEPVLEAFVMKTAVEGCSNQDRSDRN